MSPGRSTVARRGPISVSSMSPKWWPSVSLISLKWSRSMSITARLPSTADALSIASASFCWNRTRLGRPVSESWSAWYSFSACLTASSWVATSSEWVRWNICLANASGAMNTKIAQGPSVLKEKATRTLNNASPMYDTTNSPKTPECICWMTDVSG